MVPGQSPESRIRTLLFFEAAVALIALLSPLPALVPALAIDRRIGWWIYVVVVIGSVAGMFIARVREKNRRASEQGERDAEWRQGFAELRALAKLGIAAAESGPVGKPLADEIEGVTGPTGPLMGPTMAGVPGPEGPRVPMGGTIRAGLPRLILGPGGLQFVQKTTQDFPKTPEGVQSVVEQLKHYVLQAERGEITPTGGVVKMVRRDKDGNIIEER